MIKRTILFITVTIILIGCASTNQHFKRTYFPDGKVQQEWNYKEQIFHRYYENGKVHSELQLKNGIGNGRWKIYYESGKLFQDSTVNNDQWDGAYTQYFENGEKMTDGLVYKGQPIKATTYFKSGKIHEVWDYENNKYLEYYESGKLFQEAELKDHKWEGPYKQYFEDGTKMTEGILKDGEPINATTFFKNGKIHEIWDYNVNKYTEYNETGEVISERILED